MAKAIMVQGTSSGAGKSLLAAALCRIFRQDGYSVAPFKSQNMALNSFITDEGLEMGRAQVVQAQAAGIAPSVRMNPILLKPSSDTGSQVIVNGEVLGDMSAAEYFKRKRELVPKVVEAYESLAAQYDVIVLEGAGSPAEINLKAEDIVNMGMARLAKAPVLLAGDIDRGGVFASLAGTVMLLEPDERAMVRGLVINKFRGDREILRPGLDQIADITGVPVVGVVPWLDVDIDDEDSLSERLTGRGGPALVDIAVVRLPRIANFTDFAPLERIPGVSVRYAASPANGKSTRHPAGQQKHDGGPSVAAAERTEAAVKKHAAAGGAVLGICGGYQMLGERLATPTGEHGGTLCGLGCCPSDVFAKEKTRTRVTGRFERAEGIFSGLSGAAFEGYEIHMGRTERDCPPLMELRTGRGEGKPDGASRGNVCGSYVHGLFDNGETAAALVCCLCKAKGLDASDIAAVDAKSYREAQYDKLAAAVRESLDMGAVYKILEEGI
ncbi:MAG: cobyric acid synthase [Anaerotruncus massiliensis (ex Togo et al. 2019)]